MDNQYHYPGAELAIFESAINWKKYMVEKIRPFIKGDVLEVARLAGIMAAKRTGELIPLCHPLPLTSAAVDFAFEGDCVLGITATVRPQPRQS